LNQILSNGLVPLCSKIKLQSGWNYTPTSDSKHSRYLGIKNLGCICYMISMLQQFYHVPAFRYLMLGTPDLEPDNIVSYKGMEINDKLLH